MIDKIRSVDIVGQIPSREAEVIGASAFLMSCKKWHFGGTLHSWHFPRYRWNKALMVVEHTGLEHISYKAPIL